MGSSVCDRSECDSSSSHGSSFAYHTTPHSNSNNSSRRAYAHARLSGGLSGEDSNSECSSSHTSDCLADAGGMDDCDSLAGAPSVAPSASCAGSSAIGSVVDYRYESRADT